MTELSESSKDERKLFVKYYNSVIITISCLCLSSNSFLEYGYFQYSPTFSQFIPLALSAKRAADVQSYFFLSFDIARFLALFLSVKVNPRNMLIGAITLLLFGHIILLTSNQSENMLILSNILMGLGISRVWASFIAFIDKYVVVTDKINSIFMLSIGILRV